MCHGVNFGLSAGVDDRWMVGIAGKRKSIEGANCWQLQRGAPALITVDSAVPVRPPAVDSRGDSTSEHRLPPVSHHCDHDLAPRVAVLQVTQARGRVGQWIGPAEHGCDRSGVDELGDGE
jgi:hypothetical protein